MFHAYQMSHLYKKKYKRELLFVWFRATKNVLSELLASKINKMLKILKHDKKVFFVVVVDFIFVESKCIW